MSFTSNSLNLILLPNIFNLKNLRINNMEMQTCFCSKKWL